MLDMNLPKLSQEYTLKYSEAFRLQVGYDLKVEFKGHEHSSTGNYPTCVEVSAWYTKIKVERQFKHYLDSLEETVEAIHEFISKWSEEEA